MLYDQSFIGAVDNKTGIYLIDKGFVGEGGALCNAYVFSDTNPDKLTLGSPFTGNLRVHIASDSESGINPAIVAGRIGTFVASTDVLLEPVWNRYEIESVAIDGIVNEIYNGRVAYAKDGVWYYLNMSSGGVINTDGDIIENAQEASYLKGVCVQEWPSVLLRFAGGDVLRFADGKVLGFKE